MTEPTSPSTGAWRYLPSLDGVRALAVVAVVCFHFWPDAFPGGFVGVDVFFAMSGFLITGILVSEHRREGSVDLRAFWGRRVRRLVPAVVVLVAVTALAAWATDTGSSRQFADSLGALTWTTNIVEAWFGGSRVWLHNSRTTLDHLWSLAIEEQFYLFWPLIAVGLLRVVKGRRNQVLVVLGLVALSALSMSLVGGVHAYFRTDTRAFELLAGAALALSGWGLRRHAPALTGALAAAGVVGLGLFVAFVDPGGDWMYPWGFLLISLASVSLVAAAADPPPWVAAVLESPPMRHLGQVSYGVYLWHIPVLRVLSPKRMGFEGPLLHVVRFVVLALVVEASYRFVEEPFRRRRWSLGWKQFTAGYLAVGLTMLPLVGATADDIDTQWDPIDGPPKVAQGETRILIAGDLYGAAVASLLDGGDVAVWSLADPGCPGLLGSGLDEGITFDDDGQPLEILDRPYCDHWRERWTRAIDRFDPDVVVLASGYWDTLPLEQGGAPINRPALDSLYRKLVAEQVQALLDAGMPAADISIIDIAFWPDLVEPQQRDALDGRDDALAAYSDAVNAGIEQFGIDDLVSKAQGGDLLDGITAGER